MITACRTLFADVLLLGTLYVVAEFGFIPVEPHGRCCGLEYFAIGTNTAIVEFLRRFCQHILPKRFVKIRRYGIYNHTEKRNLALQFVAEVKPGIDAIIKQRQSPETNIERFERLTGVNPCICPVCKTGRMVVVRELPRIRSPEGGHLYKPVPFP